MNMSYDSYENWYLRISKVVDYEYGVKREENEQNGGEMGKKIFR